MTHRQQQIPREQVSWGLLLLQHAQGGGSIPCHACLLPPHAATKAWGGFSGNHSMSDLQTSALLAHPCSVSCSSALCQICVPEPELNYSSKLNPW